MDPNGDFGMVIAQFGRVVIFWQVFEVGGPPAILAKGPVRGVLVRFSGKSGPRGREQARGWTTELCKYARDTQNADSDGSGMCYAKIGVCGPKN